MSLLSLYHFSAFLGFLITAHWVIAKFWKVDWLLAFVCLSAMSACGVRALALGWAAL